MNHPRPRSAYVHVPFCRHRCGYCNFTVVAGRDDLIEDYLKAIEIELSWLGEPQSVDTLFFGGGTPTHLKPDQLSRFLQLVKQWFPTDSHAEISTEANPEDIDTPTADVLKQAGINRVSLGVQSFRDTKLRTLERSHTGDVVSKSVELLRPAIRSLSLDLIFGSPDESLEQWQADVQRALALNPDHLSTYGLTYERGTSFYSRRQKDEIQAVPESVELEMYEYAITALQDAGYEHYEVSNFAKPQHRCRHNENYWFCNPFYGIGPGASAFVDGKRQSNHRSTTKYLQSVLAGKSPIDDIDELSEKDLAHERLVFGLRRLEGVKLADFHEATGQHVRDLIGEPLAWLIDQGLLEIDDVAIRLTKKGLIVSDSIWPHLL